LRTLICLPQKASDTVDKASYSCSSRINPNITQYQWRIGSSIVPSRHVILRNDNICAGYAESYCEVLKSFHGFNNLYQNSLITGVTYNCWDQASNGAIQLYQGSTGAASYLNGFAIAQDLEVFANRSDVLLQGLNTIGQNIFHDITIDSTGPTSAYVLNYYANFDVILIIENGVMRVTF